MPVGGNDDLAHQVEQLSITDRRGI
jgi:hypothetical protein